MLNCQHLHRAGLLWSNDGLGHCLKILTFRLGSGLSLFLALKYHLVSSRIIVALVRRRDCADKRVARPRRLFGTRELYCKYWSSPCRLRADATLATDRRRAASWACVLLMRHVGPLQWVYSPPASSQRGNRPRCSSRDQDICYRIQQLR